MPCTLRSRLCDNGDCETCYSKSFASHPKSEFWSNKNNLTPREVFKHNNKKFWFDCQECPHDFENTLDKVAGRNQWCPYCASLKLCSNKKCKFCFDKSFASHFMAKYWSENNRFSARSVIKTSKVVATFNCPKCPHAFNVSLNSVYKISKFNTGCCYCSSKKLCSNLECKYCYKKSFASVKISKLWSNKNKISPREVFKNSHIKYWFECNKCPHPFEQSPNKIVSSNRKCIYCAKQKLCTNDKCEFCFNNSFASSKRAKYWSNKNKVKPRNEFKSSGNKFWFNCKNCKGEFNASLHMITTNNSWCSICKHKTEKFIYKWCKKYFDNSVHQPKWEWCKSYKTGKELAYDIIIKDFDLIIEIDGRQHFEKVPNRDPPEITRANDTHKTMCAIQNKLTVIRISQEDIYYNRFKWKKILKKAIKIYDEPQMICFATDKTLYDNHKKDLKRAFK